MSNLTDLKSTEFLTALASSAPAPGGGGGAAMAGALAAALASMVANLTIGKEKFAQQEPEVKALLEEAEEVRKRLLGLVEDDAAVFNSFMSCYKLPKETEEEKADRLSGKTNVVKDILATLKFRHFTLGALAIFFYITIESGIPNMANLYMSEMEGVGPVVAGSVVAAYWFAMMIGRIVGGAVGGKVSSRAMITFLSLLGIVTLLAMMFLPVKLVTVCGKTLPLSMCLLFVCGLATSVMWGGLFNLAAEGLGKYVPMGSGIFMTCVVGGVFLPLQGMLAGKIGYLGSYWFTIALFAYVFVYANFLSKPKARAE